MREATGIPADELENIREQVKLFLSRENLQCHFVKRSCKYEACFETHRLMPRKSATISYGRFDVRESIVSMISENLADPAARTEAFRYWLGHELSAYKRELEGIATPPPGAEAEGDFEQMFATMLGGQMPESEVSRGTTDKEYSVGEWCKGNFTKDVEGVSLRVLPVTLTDDEVYTIFIGMTQVEIIVDEEATTKSAKPKSINYGKGLKVKPGNKKLVKSNEVPFEESLVNTNPMASDFIERLQAILEKPKNDQPTSITCLFHGAPGTSKTALAEHIAKKLDRKLMKKSYADIQDKYISEGEKKLDKIFKEAEATNSILLMDEVDSLAQNRFTSDKEYAKTMTNQLLTSLDEYKGIVICTTNFVKSLDPAVLRRFYLKMEFKFLSEEQQKIAFRKFFKGKYRNKRFPPISYLTTGDFKVVKEKCLYEPTVPSFERVIEMLKDEVKLKLATMPELKELTKRSIGFHK